MLSSKLPPVLVFIAMLGLSGCGTKEAPSKEFQCSVGPSVALTSDSGSSDEVCATILGRIGMLPPQTLIILRAPSPTVLIGQVRLGSGQALPDVQVALPDGQVSKQAIEALADGMAGEVKSLATK